MPALWPGYNGPIINYITPMPAPTWQATLPRKIVILGSTGSIGTSALDVARQHTEQLMLIGLSCARNTKKLVQQALEFRPPYLAVLDTATAATLKDQLAAETTAYHPEILVGAEGYAQLAALQEADCVLSAQVGAAGLSGTIAAALSGKVIALANKESLVLAGDVLRAICRQTGATLLPVDSEHNALFQCLAGRDQEVERLILTASGGPFREKKREELQHVTREQALKHPNWSMGAKISIDSATMMNKALEVIEAYHLYGIDASRIDVLIHPQSVVHSLVRFHDGGLLAQLGPTDMRLPIAHCLLWPHCLPLAVPPLDLTQSGALTFHAPDTETFPALSLAYAALTQGSGSCIVLNAANEAAVALFLEGQCSFLAITKLVAAAMHDYQTSTEKAAYDASLMLPPVRDDIQTYATNIVAQITTLDHKSRQFVNHLVLSGESLC